jgi:LPS-assembly protein
MSAALRRHLALLLACAVASAASAQPAEPAASAEPGRSRGFGDQPLDLTADALDYDATRELYVARGDVVLRQGARTLRADWMAFNRRAGVGIANGHVELREGDEVLRANFVQFEVSTLEGIVQGGEIDSPVGQFRAAGDEIRKTGERSYAFEGAVFTTCRCPDEGRDPWRIRAKEAELDIGGYGVVEDATLDVMGIPVLWLPWLIVPLRTERQTGFLFPEIAVASRRGFEIGTPFFWAVRDSVNATLTPYYSTRRGFKGDALVEYVFGRASKGELFTAFAYDQDISPGSQREPFDRERWAVIGQQDWRVPGDARFHSRFRFTSDNDYPIDFEDLRERRSDRWLESWAALGRDFGASGRFGTVGSAWFANDMQSPDDIDRDDAALQRLPSLSFSTLPGAAAPGIPWLAPAFDATWTSYQSMESPGRDPNLSVPGDAWLDTGPDGVFDKDERGEGVDPHGDNAPAGGEGDGVFQEGEPLLDEGQRFDLYPRVGAPLALAGLVEVYPEIGWRQTLYATEEQNFDARGFFTGRVDLRSRLRRSFGSIVHVVEPTFGYAFVDPTSQSSNPLLQPSTELPQERIRSFDLDTVTLDPADRIRRANRVTFGAVQRLRDTDALARPLDVELALLGSYELADERFGWVIAEGHVLPPRLGATRFHVAYDPEKTQLAEALFSWRWRHEFGHHLSIGYRYRREIPDVFEDFGTGQRFDNFEEFDHIQQAFADLRLQITKRWQLGYRTAYSFESDVLLQNSGYVEYLSKCGCWAAGVELSMDRNSGVDVRVLYRLVGIGNDLGRSPLLDSLEGL